MSTITAIFEPDADGTVHVPVPAEWRHLPIKVTAEMEPAGDPTSSAYGSEWMNSFGSIQDSDFEAPPRCASRAIEPLSGK